MPDIGDFKDVPVIEMFVKVGDTVKAEDPLVTLESDKATMDVPAPLVGHRRDDQASRSATRSARARSILTLVDRRQRPSQAAATAVAAAAAPRAGVAAPRAASASARRPARVDEAAFALAYAGPAVRKLARELRRRSRQGQGHAATRAASCAKTSRRSRKGGAAPRQAASRGRRAAAASAASTCCRGRRSTSRSSARSSARSCRASRRSRPPTCTATGW